LAQLSNSFSEEAVYALDQEEIKANTKYIQSLKSKINLVSDLLINSLKELDEHKYIYTIITAHIKKEPSELT
jgi:hypothetical protein